MKPNRERAVLGAFLLLLTAVGIRCIEGPLEPIMPTTDTEFNIPILDETSTFANVVVQGPVVNNGDGTVSYVSSQQFTPLRLDSIRVYPQSAFDQVSLGLFQIAVPQRSLSVSGTTLGFPPGNYPIPSGQFTAPPVPIDISDSVGYAAIRTGILTLQVQNNLPVPVSFPNGIGLRNNSTVPFDTTTIGNFALGAAIPAGQTRTANVDVGGKTLRGKMQFDSITCSTTGSGGSPVTVGAGAGLTFSFSSTMLTADSAGAAIPSQTIANYPPGSLFTVDDSTVVQTANFRAGRLRIVFTNSLDVSVNMGVRINEFLSTLTGQPFYFGLDVPKKTKDSVTISLDSIRVATTAATLGTTLTYSAGINTIGSNGAVAAITRNDLVRVDLLPLQPFAVRSVTGKVKPTKINVNLAQGSSFSLGDLAKKMTGTFIFDSVKVKLRLPTSGGGFPTDYDLKFYVKNTARGIYDSVTLPPDKITGQRRLHPEITNPPATIVLDKASNIDSLLGKFFPLMPDSFFVRGSLLVDPPSVFAGSTTYSLTDTSKIYPGLDLDFPARFGVLNGSFQSVDPLTSKSGGDIIPKDITKSVKQATLNVEATNGFPVQMSFRMNFLGRDSVGVRDTVLRIAPSTVIQAAQVDANGYPVTPRVTSFQVSLTNADMLNLNRADSVFVRLDMQTSGGGTKPVQFRAYDRVRVRASGRIIYTINKQ